VAPVGPWTHAALVKDKESRALGLVAVRGPVGVALAARLLVAGRARRHAAADAAALEARPGADVLARVRAAPHVARAPAVCTDHPRQASAREQKDRACLYFARGCYTYVRTYTYLWRGRRSGAAEEPVVGRRPEQPGRARTGQASPGRVSGFKQRERERERSGGGRTRMDEGCICMHHAWFIDWVTLVLLLVSRRRDATKATTTASLLGAMVCVVCLWTKGGAGLEVSRVESCGLAGWGPLLVWWWTGEGRSWPGLNSHNSECVCHASWARGQ
jgi:hypothetical protein